MTDGPAIRRDGAGFLLQVKVRPGARKDHIRGIADGWLLVEVAAVAEDGRATQRLLAYLAGRFGVRKAEVELLSGTHARWKRLRIRGGVLPQELADDPVEEGTGGDPSLRR